MFFDYFSYYLWKFSPFCASLKSFVVKNYLWARHKDCPCYSFVCSFIFCFIYQKENKNRILDKLKLRFLVFLFFFSFHSLHVATESVSLHTFSSYWSRLFRFYLFYFVNLAVVSRCFGILKTGSRKIICIFYFNNNLLLRGHAITTLLSEPRPTTSLFFK